MLRSTLLVLVVLTSWSPGCSGNDGERLPGRVCESIDARNTAESLVHDLQDCRVVEGYVHIQLIDPGNNDTLELDKLSFPKLREISHHLLLFRVSGLRSLAHLFPNLAVIRGASLFDQYALVAYEMFSLQDVALPKLAVIARGGVLLEKNPLLCYVNTVDWSRIVKDRNLVSSLT
jgi:insulin receptor